MLDSKFLNLRKQFPMLEKTMHGKPLIYFDSASTAQKPAVVIEGVTNFYQHHYASVHRAVYELSAYSTEKYEKVRTKVKDFLNAKNDREIIYTKGTTESINLVATSFGKAFVQKGDVVMLSEMEHHSNLVPWQILCQDRLANLLVIPMTDKGEVDLEAYQGLLSEKTKIVALTHMSNTLGTINPIKEMISMAHNVGAKVLIDGAQAAAHLPIDVRDLDADFYVFSGHKIYGPTGVGILYGKEELLDQMPPFQGGGNMIKTVSFENTSYNDLPFKFEAGTPMIAEVIGLGIAIEFLMDIGMQNIFDYEKKLQTLAKKELKQINGLQIIGNAKNKGPIFSIVVDDIHPLDLGTLLDLEGIAVRTGHHCTQPVMKHFGITGTTRASFGLYNTSGEIEQFVESLKKIIDQLR